MNPILPNPVIHQEIPATMTGYTSFMKEHTDRGWKYPKYENFTIDTDYTPYFTHIISDRKIYTGYGLHKPEEPHEHSFPIFSRINLKGFLKSFGKENLIELQEAFYILERDDIAQLRKNTSKSLEK